MQTYSFLYPASGAAHPGIWFISLLTAILICLSSFWLQAQPGQIQTSEQNGLRVVNASTPAGKIRVNLPSTIHAGDQISGQVEAEAVGKNPRQIEKNTAYLQGCVVEIKDQPGSKSDRSILRFVAPVLTTTALAVIKDSRGNIVGHFEVPVDPEPRPSLPDPPIQPTFDIPSVGQTGSPVNIPGPADGDLSNTVVRIGDVLYHPVAESPDGIIIVPSPDLGIGEVPIQVMDNDTWTNGTIRLIDLNLSAGKLNLRRGENTLLTLTVAGLSGITEPVNIQLVNSSPGFVSLAKGNQQTIEIHPDMVSPEGTFRYIDVITGIRPGGFTITATVLSTPEEQDTEEEDVVEDDQDELRQRADELDRRAEEYARNGDEASAAAVREQARRLRQRAATQDWEWGDGTEGETEPPGTTTPTQPGKPGKSQPVPVPVPVPSGPKSEPVGEKRKKCDCNEVDKKVVYSRGNNNKAQLEQQFKNSKGKGYQYQTARMEIGVSGNPAQNCDCEQKKCAGSWVLTVDMKILNLLDPKDQPGIPDPTNFALLDGVEVKTGTSRSDQKLPAPNVKTTSENSDFPAPGAKNKFKQPNAAKRDYTATATTSVPCQPGSYHRRFLITSAAFGGGKKTPGTSFGLPDLNAYVDVKIVITEEDVCKQSVKVEAYYLEFIAQYPWHKKGGAELPEVDYDIPGLENAGTGKAEPKGKTKNIAKLIEEDGKKVDSAFPERQ